MTDYIACGRVVPERIAAIVKGIAEACVAGRLRAGRRRDGRAPRAAGARRVRRRGRRDRRGRAGRAPRARTASGPATWSIAMASSGLHSNGYSLVRHVLLRPGRLGPGPAGRRARPHPGRGAAGADPDLQPRLPGADRRGRGARAEPHHRRRAGQQPGPGAAGHGPGADRPGQLATGAGLRPGRRRRSGVPGRPRGDAQPGRRDGGRCCPGCRRRRRCAPWPIDGCRPGSAARPKASDPASASGSSWTVGTPRAETVRLRAEFGRPVAGWLLAALLALGSLCPTTIIQSCAAAEPPAATSARGSTRHGARPCEGKADQGCPRTEVPLGGHRLHVPGARAPRDPRPGTTSLRPTRTRFRRGTRISPSATATMMTTAKAATATCASRVDSRRATRWGIALVA